ncbi:MAG TPA: RES family NAD+ phosphorylase [Candidatus Binataceae bacterium]|nr:RES family NAD+ phosphorylase [Candidatus Binataceae bacterium]
MCLAGERPPATIHCAFLLARGSGVYAGSATPGPRQLAKGARLYGGRWNSRRVSMVYASTSLALAAIETFINLEPNLAPDDLVSINGEIPGDLKFDARMFRS